MNLPWLQYGCDFGANGWQPEGGVGEPDRRRRLEEVFARLSASGLRTVRWFVFCDGRCGIEFDAGGAVRGFGRFFVRDFEVALSAASRHRLSLIPVLFDYLWFRRGQWRSGVQVGGRRRLFAGGGRRALLELVVAPLLESYGREPVIRRWDLFNEPEWATLGYGTINVRTAVRPRRMRAALTELASMASEARQGTTVGLASPRGLRLLRGVAIDELQLHWYDRRARRLYPLPNLPRGGNPLLRLRQPILLGEFPTKGSALTPAELVASARRLGYSGALGWSAVAHDRYTDVTALESAI